MQSNVEEIIPEVYIHKNFINSSINPKAIGILIYRIEVKLLKIIELEISFNNIQNIEIENKIENQNSNLIFLKLNPFDNKEFVKITLFPNWSFTPKYHFLKFQNLSREYLENIIQNDVKKNEKILKECYEHLNNIPLELMPPIELNNLLDERKIEKFVDYEFPPNYNSMFSKYKDSPELNEYVIHWKRPENFLLINNEKNDLSKIILDNPEPNDIIQENEADSNFVSALSCIAEKSNLIKRLFISDDISKHGIYILKLCVKGIWKKIVIDDLFPCYPNGNPFVSHSSSFEIWILLLEKALAKIYGAYYNIYNIEISEFLFLLTGCPCIFLLRNEIGNHDNLYYKLYDYIMNKNYLVIAYDDDKYNNEKEEEEEEEESYISPYIGYSILKVIDKLEKKFFLIRRIIYNKEQQEKIDKYENNLFSNYPDLKESYSNGTIILDFEDFRKKFNCFYICYAYRWNEIRLKGNFIKTNINNNNIISNNFYILELQSDSNLIISIFQDEDSLKEENSRKPKMDISLSIIKYDKTTNEISHIQTLDFAFCPSLQMEIDLPYGNYIIYPRTSGCYLYKLNNNVTQLKDSRNNLSEIFINTIKDIFERYDIDNQSKLDYKEFNLLMENMTKNKIEETAFNNIIKSYSSYLGGLSEKGLINYFKDSLSTGEKNMRDWLKNLGYDKNLYCRNSRNFTLTVHCKNDFIIKSQDALNSGINDKLNKILLKYSQKKEIIEDKKKNVSILFLKSLLSENIITLGCQNNSLGRMKVSFTFKNFIGIKTCEKNDFSRIIASNDIEYFTQFFIDSKMKLSDLEYEIQTFSI